MFIIPGGGGGGGGGVTDVPANLRKYTGAPEPSLGSKTRSMCVDGDSGRT